MVKKTGEHWFLSFLLKNDRFSPSGFELDQFLICQRVPPSSAI